MMRREQFVQCGIVPNIPVLSTEMATRLLQAIEKIEGTLDVGFYKKVTESSPVWENRDHPLQKICQSLVHTPEITNVIGSVLQDSNILLRNIDIFIKNMKTKLNIAWHVDTPYAWEFSQGMVTCWISLTDANVDNGGLEYVIGSHKHLFQQDIIDKEQMSLKEQQINEIKSYPIHSLNMKAGEMAIHSLRTVHRSKGNKTLQRRFAIALRIFTAKTASAVAECGRPYLLSGNPLHWKHKIRDTVPISWHIQ